MSAARFKSSDDYFKSRSGLTKQVITKQSVASKRSPRANDLTVPLDLFMDVFCSSVSRYTVDKGLPITRGGDDLASAVAAHLAGERMVAVDPCAEDNTTWWHVIRFERTEALQQPFAAARAVVAELENHGIATLVEVGAGGKGHYNVWLFHERPVQCVPVTDSLMSLIRQLDIPATVMPDALEPSFKTLPLQKDAMLLQRQVFVNGVGKFIKNQADVLRKIIRIPAKQFETISITPFAVKSSPQPIILQPTVPEPERAGQSKKVMPPTEQTTVMQPSKPQPTQLPKPLRPPNPKPIAPQTVTADKIPVSSISSIFCVAGAKTYTLDRSKVLAIAGSSDAKPLPGFLDPICCWIPSEHAPIPAAYLTKLLGMETQSTEDGKVVIVSGADGMPFGLLVDAIVTEASDAEPEALDLQALLADVRPQPYVSGTATIACLLGRAGNQIYGISTPLIERVLSPGQATLSREHITVGDNSIPLFEPGSAADGTSPRERTLYRPVRRDRYIVAQRDEARVAFHVDEVLGIATVGSWVGFTAGTIVDTTLGMNGLGKSIPDGETVIVCT